MFKQTTVFALALILATAAPALATDAYFSIPVRDLKLVEGALPKPEANPVYWRRYERSRAMEPYAVLDDRGEAYLSGQGAFGEVWPQREPGLTIHIRAPEDQEVKGRLVIVKSDRSGMDVVRFVVPASAAKAEAKVPFYEAKLAYYEHLAGSDIPGGAWFRHQARLVRTGLKLPPGSWPRVPAVNPFQSDELSRAYDLFTGGRAISENLQLDRVMPNRPANETPVKIDSIAGITIKEIDWKPLIKDAQPELDPLASKIPFDQHAVFFPSFQAALAVADETKRHDTPVLRLAQPRAEDAGVVQRYERQLGLPMSTLARMIGPAMVKSVALTGSDPSFPLGTDVAVLLETDQPTMLEKALLGRIMLAAADAKDAKAISRMFTLTTASGEEPSHLQTKTVARLRCQGFASPDRRMSSYVAQLDGSVVVTNSIYQLQRLAEVRGRRTKSLADLPEYKFFRIRYSRGDKAESALVFLSDATIRRWCGPRWRIADARRTRARAVLAELQASQLEALVKHKVEQGQIHTDLPILGGGELRLTRDGIVSSVYGTLDFMTPVGEMPLDEVTQDEAQAYQAWRDGYQRNWSWGFDPIGLRIGLGKKKLAADLTIMPLILNSEYAEFAQISRGAKFAATAGDPHKSLAQFILALNRDSYLFHEAEGLASLTTAGKKISLGWIGPSASIYADDDPFWDELAKVPQDKLEDFLMKNIGRVPVAVRIDSANPLQLAVFLAAARGYIEQTGPGLTRWESLKYKDQGYVRVSPVKGQPGVTAEVENAAVYYTTVGGALTVTLSERVLKRAIDRGLPHTASDNGQPAAKRVTPRKWLGSSAALHVDARILEVANALGREQYQDRMQVLSWSNLPILNEWKRLFPDRDAVAVHRAVWGVTLVCPGGGKYVWNEKYATMESTVYGCPARPASGPPAPPVLSSFTSADFGLTLENEGLRARVELKR